MALAVLLAVEGEMARERLADLLWPGTERGVARRNLRRDLFRLRQLGLDLIDGGSHTVSLQNLTLDWPPPNGHAPDWLQGMETAAGAELDDWLAGQRPLLHRRWVHALRERAQALEHQGDEAAALNLWRAILGDDAAGPEDAGARQAALRLHQQLGQHAQALALSRSGEPAAALAPPIANPAHRGAPGHALSGPMPFVGREVLLQQIGGALAHAQRVFIAGPAGAGKTRLALEATAHLGGTLHLRCRPEDSSDAFASALRLLQLLRDAAPEVSLPAWVRQELAPLVPDWATDTTATDAKPAPAEQALLRMRRAFEAAWRALARDNFSALVLDDWQWADASSLALWNVEAAPDAVWPVAQVIVHRAGELPPAALELRRALVDTDQAVALQVPNLDAAELLQLVRTMSHSEGGERFAARLHHATAGNPLFLGETLRHLFASGLLQADAQGHWHTPYDAVTIDYAELAVPATVRETVLARARALGPNVRRVLEAASLAGDGLTPHLLAGPAGVDETGAASALEHAAAADMLVEGRDGRYGFTHDLIAQSLADSLSGARRLALHSQLAERLIALEAAPGRIAQHLQLAGQAKEASRWHQRAGQAAQRRRAWHEALRHHELALAGAEDAEQRTQIRLAAASAREALGDPAARASEIDAALMEAARVGPARTLDVLIERAAFWHQQNRPAEAIETLQAVAADPALTPAQAQRAREEHARALSQMGRHEEALPVLREAISMLPASALAVRMRLMSAAARSTFWLGDLEGAAQQTQQALDLCMALGDDYRAASVLGQLGTVARERGQAAEALRFQARSREMAARSGNLHAQRVALYSLIVGATDEGRADEAERLLDEGEALSPFWENPLFRQAFIEARFFLHYLRGHTAPARTAADHVLSSARALQHPHGHTGALILVFDLHLHTGEFDAAQALLDEADGVLAQAGGQAMRRHEVAARRVHLAQMRGQPAQALPALNALLPQFDRMREDDKGRALASGIRAAADLGDVPCAQALLVRADALATPSIEVRVMLTTARLQLATATGEGLTQARTDAAELLSQPHLPHYVAAMLHDALQAR